jgi:hypothetical protein
MEKTMRPSAMDTKLKVKAVMGILVHSDFWEGPCRGGIREEMMPEAERRNAEKRFQECKEVLTRLIPQVEVLEPVFVPYLESFVVDDDIIESVERDLHKTDVLLLLNQRIPKIERFNKPVICFTHAVTAADTCAYLRSIGKEAYYAIDEGELNQVLHKLWVRKAVAQTRVLVLTAGEVPTWGILSNIKDYEQLRINYGIEIVKIPYGDIFKYMDAVDDNEALGLTEKLVSGSKETKVKGDFLVNDLKYYLAAKKIMAFYGCNAFTTACVELCRSRIPQERKFVPCITHSLLKDEGYPSGCEEDLNALVAMIMMMYTAERPAFMGNPLYENDEMITLHHSVPCLKMNGFDSKEMPYRIYSFTGQGFGGKIQIDFAENDVREIKSWQKPGSRIYSFDAAYFHLFFHPLDSRHFPFTHRPDLHHPHETKNRRMDGRFHSLGGLGMVQTSV